MKFVFIATFLFLVTPIGYADSSVENLSTGLRALLKKEMQALEKGMSAIIPAYSSGNLEQVALIAKTMKNGFILTQEITRDQKEELLTKMSNSFLYLDKQFHEYAGMLEHVAEEKHIELVGFYYYKLNEACVGCHSQFAIQRFPAFHSESTGKGHHL